LVHSSAKKSEQEGVMTDGENGIPAAQTATPTGRVTPVAPVWHTAVFVAILLGLAAVQGQPQLAGRADRLPSRITLYAFTLGYEFFLLGYVWLFGLKLYKVPLAEIIGGKWRRWGDFWRDVGIALLFWLVVGAVLATLSFSLRFSGMEAANFMLPETAREVAVFILLALTAGFCEEIIFRGYLQRQFTAWTGNVSAGVVLQAAVFGAAHLYQGVKGIIVITIYGAMFGILAAMRKSLRPGIMQHGAQDAFSGIAGVFLKKYHYLQMLKF
jgi:membrane protease YdiL (CAAX protease family)